MKNSLKWAGMLTCTLQCLVLARDRDITDLSDALANTCNQIQSIERYSYELTRIRDDQTTTKILSMDGDYVLEKDFDARGQLERVSIRNEEYLAALVVSGDAWSLQALLRRDEPGFRSSFSTVRHPALSHLFFAGERIDDFAKSSKAQLESIDEMDIEQIVSYTIRSSDAMSILNTIRVDVSKDNNCVVRVVRTLKDGKQIHEASEFLQFTGSLVPTKITSSFETKEDRFEGSDLLSYRTDPAIDTRQCYLPFYGLGDPDVDIVGRPERSSFLLYSLITAAVVVGAGSAVLYLRAKKYTESTSV